MSPKYRFWRHLFFIFALYIISVNYAIPPRNMEIFKNPVFHLYILSLLATYLITIYVNIFWLIPKYLLKKRYSGYLCFFFIFMLILLLSQYYIEYFFSNLLNLTIYPTYNFNIKWKLAIDIISTFSLNLLAFVGGSVTVLIKHWIISNKEISRLEQEHLQAEVIHLKEQVSPDFLFSTMNHISSLESLNPDIASQQLLKLCRLLRYQLYDGNMEKVFLLSEIKYISNYLELQQLIYPKMEFEIKTEGEVQQTLIPPLIFVPFLQQILHYIPDRNTTTKLFISFKIDTDNLFFICTTDFKYTINPSDLQQILQRIHLLFEGDYDLNTKNQSTTDLFSTALRIRA